MSKKKGKYTERGGEAQGFLGGRKNRHGEGVVVRRNDRWTRNGVGFTF
jgi:hypothetical protein